ncbi:unnamed protein product [Cuscuta epithymum]|uniref:Uncharacterized protein n=1 Tax=Cuscuta epithymum TaxID=186058 RepID=A0AAV0EKR4_9ASTE|nr:unnamed protein product [Cuscuta epithymum]
MSSNSHSSERLWEKEVDKTEGVRRRTTGAGEVLGERRCTAAVGRLGQLRATGRNGWGICGRRLVGDAYWIGVVVDEGRSATQMGSEVVVDDGRRSLEKL